MNVDMQREGPAPHVIGSARLHMAWQWRLVLAALRALPLKEHVVILIYGLMV
jgi:hypothetical protein